MKTYIATFMRHNPQTGNYETTRKIEAKTIASARKQARDIEKACVYGSMSLINIEEQVITETTTKEETTMKNYSEMTSKELKELAKERKISNWWNLRKDQLIAALDEYDRATAEEQPVEEQPIEEPVEEPVEEEQPVEEKSAEKSADTKIKVQYDKPKRGQLIEFNGKAQNICAWAKELGISANTLYGRLYKLGWPLDKALAK